jgi:hypothetical protein
MLCAIEVMLGFSETPCRDHQFVEEKDGLAGKMSRNPLRLKKDRGCVKSEGGSGPVG